MKYNLFIKITLLFFLIVQGAEAQIYQSPYSRYGLGELKENTPIRLQSMGYAQSSLMDSNYNGINYLNPASNSQNQSFAFESGVSSNFYQLKTKNESFKNKDYYIQTLSISIPLWKKREMGLNIGLAPFSKIGYSIKSGNGKDTQYWKGSGGFNNYSLGVGLKVVKGLYIGGTIAYMYGRDELNQDVIFNDVASGSITKRFTASGGGINFRTGFIFKHKFDSNRHQFSIGGSFRPQSNFKTSFDNLIYTYLPNENYIIGDTLDNSLNTQGKFVLPLEYSLGASMMLNNKFLISLDYSFTQWSKFILNSKQDNLNDMISYAIGLQYNHSGGLDERARYNLAYYKKISYRAGFRYSNSYLPSQPVGYSITTGFGLPIGTRGTSFDVGLEYGKIGSPQTSEITNQYFKVSFGFKVFDIRWFEKRKYE